VNLKVLPLPTPSLSAQIRPPCASTRPLQIANPNPVPPMPRDTSPWTRWKRSKILS